MCVFPVLIVRFLAFSTGRLKCVIDMAYGIGRATRATKAGNTQPESQPEWHFSNVFWKVQHLRNTARVLVINVEILTNAQKRVLRNNRKLQERLCYSKLPVHIYSSAGAHSLIGACAKKCANTVGRGPLWPNDKDDGVSETWNVLLMIWRSWVQTPVGSNLGYFCLSHTWTKNIIVQQCTLKAISGNLCNIFI